MKNDDILRYSIPNKLIADSAQKISFCKNDY